MRQVIYQALFCLLVISVYLSSFTLQLYRIWLTCLIIPVFVCVLLLLNINRLQKIWIPTPLWLCIFALSLIMLLSYFFSRDINFCYGYVRLYLGSFLLLCGLLIYFATQKIEPALKIMFVVGIPVALLGILENPLIGGENISAFLLHFHDRYNSHPLLYRVSSVFLNPNHFGIFCAIVILIGLYLYHRKKLSIAMMATLLPLYATGLAMSGSRNGWLLFFVGVGIAYIFFKWLTLKQVMAVVLIGILMLLTFPQTAIRLDLHKNGIFPFIQFLLVEKPSAEQWEQIKYEKAMHSQELPGRLQIWQKALKVELENPVFGVGPGYSRKALFADYDLNAHNSFLNFLIEFGMFGLCVFSIFSLLVFWYGIRYENGIGLFLFVLVFLSHIFDFILETSLGAFIFYLPISIICAAMHKHQIQVKEDSG